MPQTLFEVEQFRKQQHKNKTAAKPIWDYISIHALTSIRILRSVNGTEYETYLERHYFIWILWYINQGRNDIDIAQQISKRVERMGYSLEVGKLMKQIRVVRDKCKQEMLVLGIAMDPPKQPT